MPLRKVPLASGETYHVLNRGVNFQPIFIDKRDYQRALELVAFYQFVKPPLRFSFYNRLGPKEKESFWQQLNKSQKLVSLFAFCFMPNHFHFLAQQTKENGISKFLANFQNSYTKYLNTHHKRIGHLFQGQFKAVRVETQEQLLHTSRYIHLNPYTSFVIKNIIDLEEYQWGSLVEYLGRGGKVCETKTILSNFFSRRKYLQFILDQKDYQRELEQIKHLVLEEG